MIKHIFIINGSGGVGKDTFIEFVNDEQTAKVINYSSVDRVKEIAREIGWTGRKTERDRKLLSDLKKLCSEYNDLPFLCMQEKVNEFLKSNCNILFLHIREPEEIERAKKSFQARTILIRRDNIEHIVTNVSDRDVFEYSYDFVINNDSDLTGLKRKAKEFVANLVQEQQ